MLRRLKSLGLTSYREYLEGSHWRALRRRALGQRCSVCGETKGLVLHHSTYARLGAEPAHDLHTLCGPCHVAVHRASARTGHLMPLGRPVTAKTYSALAVGCALCSARPGEFCHTPSGAPRHHEHKVRRQMADALARKSSSG